jgi:hypothetical protein
MSAVINVVAVGGRRDYRVACMYAKVCVERMHGQCICMYGERRMSASCTR